MIYHMIKLAEWETAVLHQTYSPASIEQEGFIHCSTKNQILFPANQLYRGQPDLQLLCIDPAKVTADIVFEDCYESGMAFPHIYGPLNLNAVVKVVPFPCRADGTFSLPPDLISEL